MTTSIMDSTTSGSAKYRLAIAAIFKNEGPYLLEWLAYHRSVGVEHFYIADDSSTDGSSDLLKHLDELGIITYIPFRTQNNAGPQLPAYNHIVQQYGAQATLLAFIDGDEFFVSEDPAQSLPEVFDSIFALDPQAGAVAVNWASYGSSGHRHYEPGLVTKRFTKRAPKEFPPNVHYKSVIRPQAYLAARNPHHMALVPGFHYIDVRGCPLTLQRKGLASTCSWDRVRINHYAVKSFDEFLCKQRRGRATLRAAEAQRKGTYFKGRDRNDQEDGLHRHLLEATEAELANLKSLLLTNPGPTVLACTRFNPLPLLDGHLLAVNHHPDGSCSMTGFVTARNGTSISFEVGPEGGEASTCPGAAELLTSTGAGSDNPGAFRITLSPSQVAKAKEAPVYCVFGPYRIPLSSLDLNSNDLPRPTVAASPSGYKQSNVLSTSPRAQIGSDGLEQVKGSQLKTAPNDMISGEQMNNNEPKIETPRRLVMDKLSIAPFENHLRKAKVYLEFGSGGSTIRACELGVPEIHTVETSKDFLDEVIEDCNAIGYKGTIHPHFIDIGPTKSWGYPVSRKSSGRWPAYYVSPWKSLEEQDKSPDLILVDGRFRVAVFLYSLLMAKIGTTILVDDYAKRGHYHLIEQIIKPVGFHGRMAEFRKTTDPSIKHTIALLGTSAVDPK